MDKDKGSYAGIPVQNTKELVWQKIQEIPISECGEPLVSVGNTGRIRVNPVYFAQDIEGAINSVLLRRSVADRLTQVVSLLPETYGLEIFDGWRPIIVQRALRENMKHEIEKRHPEYNEVQVREVLDCFAADPDRAGMPLPHLTGGSVDVGLFDIRSGKSLDMGSEFDTTGHLSYSDALEKEGEYFSSARNLRRILIHAMKEAGFSNLPTEWWHFDYGNQNWAYFTQQGNAVFGAVEEQDT